MYIYKLNFISTKLLYKKSINIFGLCFIYFTKLYIYIIIIIIIIKYINI